MLNEMKEKLRSGRPPEIPKDPRALTQIGPLACKSGEKRAIMEFTAALNLDLSEFMVRAAINEIRRAKDAMSGMMKGEQ